MYLVPIRKVILEIALLIWYLVNQTFVIVISLYYYVLSNIEHASKSHKRIPLGSSKVPRHIALCFTNEANSLDLYSIARLLFWCKQLEVEQITLYDELGRLKDRQKELLKLYEYNSDCGQKAKGYLTNLSIISRKDGRSRFIEDVRELIKSQTSITYDEVGKRVGWSVDPDLLISFGQPLCLFGFPPWQLRLTEILSLPTHKNIPCKIFIDCLKRYSGIKQRFGT